MPYYPPAMTVQEIVRLYLSHCASEGTHCAEAKADRERTLSLFCAHVGTLDVTDAKPYHLTDFINLYPNWRSVSTKRAKANMVRAAFQWATDQERIERNPFRRVRYAEAERRPDLSDSDLERIAKHANKCFEYAIRFLRFTGCRLSELCRAQWADIDCERGVWVIPRHKSRRYTGKSKLVALVDDAVELIQAIDRTSEFVFVNNRNQPWNRRTLGQQFARLKRKLHLNTSASLHGIRHRAASAAIANGAPIKLVAQQLGHASTVVTERYYCDLTNEIDLLRAAMQRGIQGK